MRTFFYLLGISSVLICCKSPEQASQPKPVTEKTEAADYTAASATPQTRDSLLAYIERTACYGTCPIYKFSIYDSGYAVYEGKRFVEKIGKFESQVRPSVLMELKEKAKAINYSELKDVYPKQASDFPSVKTAMVLDGKRKEVNNGSGGTQGLREFEKYLDSVKDSFTWKEVK